MPVPPAAHKLADHSADRRMVLLAAMALGVGAGAALGAWVLLKAIALATNLFWFGRISTADAAITDTAVGPFIVAIPVIGALMIGVMARFGSDKIRGHGIPEAIEAILYGQSRLSPKVAILKPISAAVEVLLFEWKPRSFVPVVVAVLVAMAVRPLLIGSGPMFPLAAALPPMGPALAIAGLVGLAVGLEAALLSALLYRIEDAFHRLPIHWMWWPALGALVVGVGGLIDAHVLGAGYGSIQALLDGSLATRVVVALLVVKAVVWLVALGSGTSGGILAPLLILGGAAGALAGQLWLGNPGVWALVGMAGILSGAMRAPLTGALFAAEVTGLFDALPLTIASACGAYAVSVLLMKRSILTEKIARRGRHIRQEYVVDPMDFVQVRDLMTPEPATLPATMIAAEVFDFFAGQAAHRSYPVVDAAGRLVGLVSRSDVLGWRVADMPDDRTLADLVSDAAQPVAYADAPIGQVADLMVETGVGRIPIVDPATRKVQGILSRHDLLKARRDHRRAETARSR